MEGASLHYDMHSGQFTLTCTTRPRQQEQSAEEQTHSSSSATAVQARPSPTRASDNSENKDEDDCYLPSAFLPRMTALKGSHTDEAKTQPARKYAAADLRSLWEKVQLVASTNDKQEQLRDFNTLFEELIALGDQLRRLRYEFQIPLFYDVVVRVSPVKLSTNYLVQLHFRQLVTAHGSGAGGRGSAGGGDEQLESEATVYFGAKSREDLLPLLRTIKRNLRTQVEHLWQDEFTSARSKFPEFFNRFTTLQLLDLGRLIPEIGKDPLARRRVAWLLECEDESISGFRPIYRKSTPIPE